MKIGVLNPSGSAFGYVHELARHLADTECEVELLTSPFWHYKAQCLSLNYNVKTVFYQRSQLRSSHHRIGRLFWRGWRFIEHICGMARVLLRVRQYAVIHVQWLTVPAMDVLFLWAIARLIPVVYTVHNLYPHDQRISVFHRFLFRMIYRSPDALIVHSDRTRQRLIEELSIEAQKIRRIPHGNFAYLNELVSERGSLQEKISQKPMILFFGSIRAHKGLDVLIRAMAQVAKRLPETELLIAGVPRIDLDSHYQLVDQLSIKSNVVWQLDYVEETDIPSMLSRAWVVVLPYREIEQSGVAITACTFGKPIVVTAVGGLAELVKEAENGLVVPVDDDQKLAEAICRVLEDRDLRQRFGYNSKRYAESELDWEIIAKKTTRLYRFVVEQTRS